jgi:hypothetical protein
MQVKWPLLLVGACAAVPTSSTTPTAQPTRTLCFTFNVGSTSNGGTHVYNFPADRVGAVCPTVVNSSNWVSNCGCGNTFSVITSPARTYVSVTRTDVFSDTGATGESASEKKKRITAKKDG